jgi:acyl carrier protein
MASTVKVPLGAATLNRKWYLDVNTNTDADPTWLGVFGIEEFKAVKDPNLEDDSDFDNLGWKSSTVTALAWAVEVKLARKMDADEATAYDPGQEVLRLASDGMGIANVKQVRWYEMTTNGPKVEAYMGWVAVSWEPDGGDLDALDTVSVKLTGQGEREAIAHPDLAAAVPRVYSVDPVTKAAAGGGLAHIIGIRFTGTVGTTGVKFGTTNSPSWVVVSDNEIVATIPAHAEGAVHVDVTNATGISIDPVVFTYTA